MTLSTKIIYNVTATAFNIAAGFLRNKIFAIYLSFTLFGILSLMQQSAGLLFTLFVFGLPLAFSTISAQQINESLEKQKEIISKMILLIFSIAFIAGIIIAVFLFYDSNKVSQIIVNNREYASGVAIILFSVPFMIIQNSLFSILEGKGLVKEVVFFKIVPAIIGLPIMFYCVYTYKLTGAALGLVLNESLFMLAGLYLLRKWFNINRKVIQFYNIIPSIFKIAFLSVAVGVGSLAADFVVKRYVLEVFGELENGIIQSISKITDLYPSVALSWLIVHLFPEVAKYHSDKQKICNIIERITFIAVVIVVPIIIILFTFRGTVLEILYKKDFIIASEYFGAMLAVGIPKVVAWVMAAALLPLNLKRHWFYASIIFIGFYAMGVWLGMKTGMGIISIPIAYGLALIIQILYVFWVYHNLHFSFSKIFYRKLLLISVLLCTVICASVNALFLLFTLFMFIIIIWRYRILEEVRDKLYAYFKS
jgi:PST family polysaccharide transporter